MKQRGQQSASAIATLAITQPLDRVSRQPAPHELTDEQTELWVSVVNSQPADWFCPANVPLLVQYCRHYVEARHVAEWLERAKGDKDCTISDYNVLLKMQERETCAMNVLAVKMRLAQQSTTNHRGNRSRSIARKPWEG